MKAITAMFVFFAVTATIKAQTIFFMESDSYPCAGDTVIFRDYTTGNILSWEWSFPDGNPSNVFFNQSNHDSIVGVVWDTAGYHRVLLKIICADSLTMTLERGIHVAYSHIFITSNDTVIAPTGDSVLITTTGELGIYTWFSRNPESIIAYGLDMNSIYVHQPGLYVVKHETAYGCSSVDSIFIDTPSVINNTPPLIYLDRGSNIKIYPNPASQYVKVEGLNGDHEIEIVITDLIGRKIIGTNERYMDISKLISGIYIISSKDIFCKKLIVVNE